MIGFIGLGGSLGAACRYVLGIVINKYMYSRHSFPFSTLCLNMTGSLLLGIFANLYVHHYIAEWVWYLVGIGFCGAYTTFSTFGYETISLVTQKKYKLAIVYVFSSMVGSFLFVSIGLFSVHYFV